jgi:hypothetical protein
MARMCAFCPANAVEEGGEHVWDNWLNKVLPNVRYRALKFTLGSPVLQYDTNSLNAKLPVVCKGCNSGWMSALSLKVKERFSRTILDGEPFSLGGRDAAILAAFTFLKAVVTNHTIDDEPFFTRAARDSFRTSLAVPPVTKMWFAAYQARARMSTRNSLAIFSTDAPGPLYGLQFCSFSYVVGKLALQLLAPRWKHVSHRGRHLLSLSPNVYWDQAAILFWPHNGGFLLWPPAKYIGDDIIQEFIERFGMPVNVPIS